MAANRLATRKLIWGKHDSSPPSNIKKVLFFSFKKSTSLNYNIGFIWIIHTCYKKIGITFYFYINRETTWKSVTTISKQGGEDEGLAWFWKEKMNRYRTKGPGERPYILLPTGCAVSVGGWKTVVEWKESRWLSHHICNKNCCLLCSHCLPGTGLNIDIRVLGNVTNNYIELVILLSPLFNKKLEEQKS